MAVSNAHRSCFILTAVSIKLGSKLQPFNDAIISAETNGSCGVGELLYDNDDFFRVEQATPDCPLLLTTNRNTAMHRLPPLRWNAPKCGCVHFRYGAVSTTVSLSLKKQTSKKTKTNKQQQQKHTHTQTKPVLAQ